MIREGDVLVNSYLNLDRKGIAPQRLAKAKPGIISMNLRCFDFEGPWANSKGFDPIAVAVSGFCADEGSIDAPIMPVTDIYADFLAAYVAASAVTATLLRQI